ncbi:MULTISPECIES: hypothetical protein [Providencia]|uniref:hypothetical protein n=1 Tax=Providencia TaxID=586 RepID=UPI00248121C1|nr:hypothetical protein [Providencia rettgeri]EMA4784614.1 hypothetical protein [Providencia rettgeri]EMB3084627.1 hypothetical protein [Providencia rettgeri]MDU7495979.1 hypothetical protein [Providencia rettgeri]HEM8139372.1 hypothetical protein [Providencia rettgeri]HEM8308058.1 hypothetical protein [Providencia rettgeri]
MKLLLQLIFCFHHYIKICWAGLILMGYLPYAYSYDSFVVQNGRGLVGVMRESFSVRLYGNTLNEVSFLPSAYVQLTFYGGNTACRLGESDLMEIDGVMGVPLNSQKTLMLVPEVIYTDNRSWNIRGNSFQDTVTAIFNGYGSTTSQHLGNPNGCIWLPNQSTPNNGKDGFSVYHNVSATGRVLIYGTGEQRSGWINLPNPLQLLLRDPRSPGPFPTGVVMPAGRYNVDVSDLGCTLMVPTSIDFGPQPANSSAGQLLATKSGGNLLVNCQQKTVPISATLSLSAGINVLYYSGNEYEVNLLNSENKAGAYVTMSIDIDGRPTNIPFNREFINIGNINANQSNTNFSYPITYNLYSRGTDITGKIKGSAELSIVLR